MTIQRLETADFHPPGASSMHTEFIEQYDHTWRILKGIVADFSPEAWRHYGCGTMTPVRDALHLVQGIKYYLSSDTPTQFVSGKSFDSHSGNAPEDQLPTQADLLVSITELQGMTTAWLTSLDFTAVNSAFPWAGATQLSVALFLLRHMLYHLGELSSMLNESKQGVAEDNWVKAL
jgi:hypothetical protein